MIDPYSSIGSTTEIAPSHSVANFAHIPPCCSSTRTCCLGLYGCNGGLTKKILQLAGPSGKRKSQKSAECPTLAIEQIE